MQLLDLPLEVFRIIVACTVRELGLEQSMKARLVCHEILDAVITTRVVEQVKGSFSKMVNIGHHPDVIARYLHHRMSTDGPDVHPWITIIRETCRMLARYTNAENDPAKYELLERCACACVAAYRGSRAIESFVPRSTYSPFLPLYDGGLEANGLALAAWMGDLELVKSLHKGLDSSSFFGSLSWAAATQGHRDILQFCLDEGLLSYENVFGYGPDFSLNRTPLAAAAYMGHENIVQLYLQLPYYSSETHANEGDAVSYAAQGNQVKTLKMLLEHVKAKETPKRYMATLDWALVCSCRRGAEASAQVALEYGADANETSHDPRSCLQLAAIAGSAPIVKMLLDASAEIEASNLFHRHSSGKLYPLRKHKDALTEAKERDYPAIVQLIEEAQRVRAIGA